MKGQIDLRKFAEDAGIDQKDLRHLNAGFKRWATSPDGPHRLLIPLNAEGNVDHAELAISQATAINFQNHVIAQGDSLSAIARKYGVSVSALQKSNGLSNSRIRAGRNLLVPVRGTASNSGNITTAAYQATSAAASTHTVRRGDTLWSISRRYNVEISNLLAWNNLSVNQVLNLNQVLKVIGN